MPDSPPLHRTSTSRPAFTKRPAADQRTLTGRPWRRLRERVLIRDRYLCQACLRQQRVTVATEVDHIRALADGGAERDMANLQSLCRKCHSLKTALEGAGGASHPGWLPKPACPVTLVSGPPGAGKTTYARTHAGVEDVVIDLDDCFTDVCGVHGHTADRVHLPAALRWRNRQLADLARLRNLRAYVIVAAPTDAECQWWCTKLNAQHVRLLPDMDLCMTRVEPARQPLVRAWFEARRANDWRAPR